VEYSFVILYKNPFFSCIFLSLISDFVTHFWFSMNMGYLSGMWNNIYKSNLKPNATDKRNCAFFSHKSGTI